MSVLTPVKCSRSLNELSERLPTLLFTNDWLPSDKELADTFERIKLSHQAGSLNKNNVSLYQQRLIASLMVLDITKKNKIGNVLELSGIWQYCISIFKNRLDSLTVEIIIGDFSNIIEFKATESKLKIINDVHSLAKNVVELNKNIKYKSVRLSKISAFITGGLQSEKGKAWLQEATNEQIKIQLNIVSIFNDAIKTSKSSPIDLASDCNAFLMTYIKSGNVKNIWIYSKESSLEKLSPEQQKLCEYLQPSHRENMLLIVQVGSYLWVQTEKLENYGVHKLPDSFSSLRSVVSDITEKQCNYYYLFSKKGFWQYRLSLTLRTESKFIPKRSDYLTS